MALEALFVEFVPGQDRLLFRVHYDGTGEMAYWFTRRLVKRFWPVLLKLAEAPPDIRVQSEPARRALVEMRHQEALSGLKFAGAPEAQVKEAQPKRRAAGEPVVITGIRSGRRPDGRTLLTLSQDEGPSWDLVLNDDLLHGVIELIRKAVAVAEWDVQLELPRAGFTSPTGGPPGASN